MGRRQLLAGAAGAAVALLAGCGSTVDDPPATGSASPHGQALLEQREAAGIAACPVTDPHAAALPGGLPAVEFGCLGTDSQVNLAGVASGRPLIVNFWASWCPPCRKEAPLLGQLYGRLRGRVDMIGVLTSETDPSAAIELARRAGMVYPMLIDSRRQAQVALKVTALPQTFFVDARGRVVHRAIEGFDTIEELNALVTKYLGVKDA